MRTRWPTKWSALAGATAPEPRSGRGSAKPHPDRVRLPFFRSEGWRISAAVPVPVSSAGWRGSLVMAVGRSRGARPRGPGGGGFRGQGQRRLGRGLWARFRSQVGRVGGIQGPRGGLVGRSAPSGRGRRGPGRWTCERGCRRTRRRAMRSRGWSPARRCSFGGDRFGDQSLGAQALGDRAGCWGHDVNFLCRATAPPNQTKTARGFVLQREPDARAPLGRDDAGRDRRDLVVGCDPFQDRHERAQDVVPKFDLVRPVPLHHRIRSLRPVAGRRGRGVPSRPP